MPGRVFMGRYETSRLLGEGGMGRVFLALDRESGREVVVKVLHDSMASQPHIRTSFQQETAFLARFRHPHVVALLDAAVHDHAGPCLVMEYVAGVTLGQLLVCHRRLDPVRVGRLLGQLCLALHAAEGLGIIHRDLKPANLMVADPDTPAETLKVMDFGLAKLSSALYLPKERLANPERFFSACGTPDYICPEQVRGDEIDHRSDLYSVGVVLFELFTGRLPFARPTMQATMLAHADDPPPSFAAAGAVAVPAGVEGVVRACLAKFPVERPQNARELMERYEKALGRKFVRPEEWVLKGAPPRPPAPVPALVPAAEGARPTDDPDTIVQHLEAWMPERIAVVKLQGFVQDAGGEVVESVPGLIRVRLAGARPAAPPPPSRSGLWARLGLERRAPAPAEHLELELHMEKQEAGHLSRLRITALMRPENGRRLTSETEWRTRCEEVQRDLKAYLIGRS